LNQKSQRRLNTVPQFLLLKGTAKANDARLKENTKKAMPDVAPIEEVKMVTASAVDLGNRHPAIRGLGPLRTEIINLQDKVALKRLFIQIQEVNDPAKSLLVDLVVSTAYCFSDLKGDLISFREDVSANYLNISIDAKKPEFIWAHICNQISSVPKSMRDKLGGHWMVSMEGDSGWDDYLLLDTFKNGALSD
jgi:hypothetical protein